jgi:hypothetical protein
MMGWEFAAADSMTDATRSENGGNTSRTNETVRSTYLSLPSLRSGVCAEMQCQRACRRRDNE